MLRPSCGKLDITNAKYTPRYLPIRLLESTLTALLPEYHHPEFSQHAIVRKLFETVIDLLVPDYALVTEQKSLDLTFDNWDSLSIDWMTYSANPTVCQLLPPDIQCECFGPGTLITVSDEVSSAENPEHAAKALTISNCLAGKVTRR